jgi:hypothetical protein
VKKAVFQQIQFENEHVNVLPVVKQVVLPSAKVAEAPNTPSDSVQVLGAKYVIAVQDAVAKHCCMHA